MKKVVKIQDLDPDIPLEELPDDMVIILDDSGLEAELDQFK